MSMAFSPEGRLWVGTQDGAAWYDGHDWNTLDLPGREISNYVESVLPRKDGSVCFGRQDGGIAVWSKGTWRRYSRQDGLPTERINALAETFTSEGAPVLWAGTFGGGLHTLEGSKWVPWRGEGNVPSRIWRLIPSIQHPGALWVCGDHGLARIEQGRAWTLPGMPKVSVNAVLESRDAQGREDVWISTFGQGMARYYKGELTFLQRKQGMPSDLCTDVAQTESLAGNRLVWFATVGGLVRWEEGRMEIFDARRGLPTYTIYRLRSDPFRADGLWVGTHGAGVVYYREGGWMRHDALSGLPGNIVLSLANGWPNAHGPSVLAGTHLGVARWQEGRWTTVKIPAQLQGNRINALAEFKGPSGKPVLWVGSLSGLGRLENGAWKVFDRGSGLPYAQVTSLLVVPGPREDVWVGTQGGGLAHYVDGAWSLHGTAQGLPSEAVLALATTPDPDGGHTVWAGLKGGGLARFRKGVWRYWNRDQGLPNNVIGGLFYAQRSDAPRLWIGTQGRGILFLDPREEHPTFHNLEDQLDSPLPSQLIYQLCEDPAGRVYANTPQGVVRLVPNGDRHYRLEQYTEVDGLPSAQGTSALLLDHQAHLWAGSILGAGELNTQLPDGKDVQRPLALTVLDQNGKEIEEGATPLPRKGRSLTFLGTLLATPRPEKILFRSQLEGFEDQPSLWTRDPKREYLNLPVGTFTFLLWVRDERGKEIGPLRREVRIPPTMWETWPFRVMVMLLLAGGLWLLLRWYLGRITRQRAILENLVHERTLDLETTNLRLQREVEERTRAESVKDEFLAVVSHELRTPLTAIRGALGLLEHSFKAEPSSQISELVTLADRNSRRLLALVNDLLDIQKFETGHMSLERQPLDLKEAVNRSLHAYGGLSATYRCSFSLDAEEGAMSILGDPSRLEQILANLLSNAAKFSPDGSTVRVSITRTETRARVAVTNQGLPIPQEFRPRIFQKFAQADGSSTRAAGGTGLGLAIAKALVEAHGGSIGFTSDETATTFWFELPLAGS